MLTSAQRIPIATYRLQLSREFTLGQATAIAGYAQELGVSDFYCSPIFLSTPGSTHGYDVNDYRRIDPELGGRTALEKFHAELSARGMGLLLDFVPNHMGINGPGLLNTWWRDVLENGEHSRHARFFDIDWSAGGEGGRPQVLVPVLGDQYGRVLEDGGLALTCEAGGLAIALGEMRFPVSPRTYAAVLEPIVKTGGAGGELAGLASAFGEARPAEVEGDPEAAKAWRVRVTDLQRQLGALLESHAAVKKLFDERLAAINGRKDDARSFDELDRLIARQHYRLAYWKTGVHEINYRRFFAIDSLIGLRMENPEVFHECHALLARLVQEGVVTGLRIDHVDGLRDPAEYLDRLQSLARRDVGEATPPFYVVVEKILADGEGLPPEWSAHGTTGYEFIPQLAGLLVDARSERRFTEIYARLTESKASFDEVIYEEKRLVLDEMFANAVQRLAGTLAEILQGDRRWRDLTRHELMVAVREIMAAHGVYRTYRRGTRGMDERDRRVVEQACAIAVARNRRMGAAAFELVRDALTGIYPDETQPEEWRRKVAEWVLDFQQYTGAVMAKSVEDTAFYSFSRFIALNEVGGDPGRFGGTIGGFHAANAERARVTPQALIATATHDTKLGEDVRARLYALSEIPSEWREWWEEWRELNRGHKTSVEGRAAPSPEEEYRLYQVLLGAWPADDAEPDEAFRTRIREHLRKAVNEAKRNSTWLQPNEAWLAAGDKFVEAILNSETAREFLASFRRAARRLAHLGMVNSLTQVVLKCTSPGVPDFYQGVEFWDLSLVDPDNRRAVDFEKRERAVKRLAVGESEGGWAEALRNWRGGEIKLMVTRALLQLRGKRAALFQRGGYRALATRGRFAENVVAFERASEDERVIVVVPRLTSLLGCPPLGLVWEDTTVGLDEGEADATRGRTRSLRDVLTGRELGGAGELRMMDLFAELPFAVLVG